jgi:5-methylcytosine-specific restriction protein B
VEGIKATTVNQNITYSVEDGIFKKLVKKAKNNYEDSKKTTSKLYEEKTLKQKLELFLNDSLENENEFSKTKGGKFKIKDLDESTIYIHSNDSRYNDNTLELDIDEFISNN